MVVPAVVTRDISPFVSTDWLERHLDDPKLVVVDTRKEEEYTGGHVPGALTSSFDSWIIEKDKLLLELPADDDLLASIGSLGIKPDSMVVVVGASDNDYSRADATRVALTMIYAGLTNVSVLDGGYTKWLREEKPVSARAAAPRAVEYKAGVNRAIIASKEYVMDKIGKSVIVDNRDASVYFGAVTEPFAPRPGHIKSAVSLPTPWVYTEEGTLLGKDAIEAMAAGVIGEDKSKEVIVYCGVGGYASTWWFLLTRVLGYENVKFYDGSAQEWVADPEAPMTAYSWR